MVDSLELTAIGIRNEKLKDCKAIVALLSRWKYEIPPDIINDIQYLREEIKLIEKATHDYQGMIFCRKYYLDEFRQVSPPLDSSIPQKQEKRIFQFAYNYVSEGHIIEKDGSLFLLVIEPKNETELLLHLNQDLSLDESWLDDNNCSLVKQAENDDWIEDYESDLLPCDEDPTSCGVTCFNCPIGN